MKKGETVLRFELLMCAFHEMTDEIFNPAFYLP